MEDKSIDIRFIPEGQRVKLVSGDITFKKEIWDAPETNRGGCFIQLFRETHHYTYIDYMCIALDYPLNIRPTENEIRLSNELLQPRNTTGSLGSTLTANNLLLVPSSSIGRSIWLESSSACSTALCPKNRVLLCAGCNMGNRREDMLYTCDLGHMLCACHMFPFWDYNQHCPDLEKIKQFVELYTAETIALGIVIIFTSDD